MDIKQLYYFTAVAQAGSYSKAAESLAVSQPTLSVTVKKLEEELGVQLFYAFNREQHLTDEGLRLWTKAKQILDLYQETLDDMKTTNKNSSGKFTLGLSPLFGACFFGDLIPNFSMEYPNIEIKMIEDGRLPHRPADRARRGGYRRHAQFQTPVLLCLLSFFHPEERGAASQEPPAGEGALRHGLPAPG